MNSNGFTLFTALIAFVLIVLSMLLVQSMISTERSVSDIISDISEQEEMQAMADLSRADALQVFNYGIRYSIEELSTRPDEDGTMVSYIIFPSTISSWSNLQKEFVKSRFGVGETGKNNFASRTAKHLISLLEKTPNTREFSFHLEGALQSEMETILSDIYNEQAGGSNLNSLEEFFEIVNCENGDYDNCTGTFYITMDLSADSIDDSTYEKFPIVRVSNEKTGRTLKEPILPRGKFRIYVPIRLFKALAGAKEIGEDIFTAPIDLVGNKSEMKRELESAVRASIASGGYETKVDGFELGDWDVVVVAPPKTAPDGTPLPSSDTLQYFEVNLFFKDENPNYRVSILNENIYGIKLQKTFG